MPAWIVAQSAESTVQSGIFPLRGNAAQPAPSPVEHHEPEPAPIHPMPAAESMRPPEHVSFVPPTPMASSQPDPALSEALERCIADLVHVRTRVLKQSEQQLVALAARIARRVIGREIAEDPRILMDLATEGIEALVSRDQTTVRVGDWMDERAFESFRARLQAQRPGCRVVQDSSIGPGGCIVETDMGKVDESVDTRLANVLAGLPTQETTHK
ncbi:MAG: hypothetical protein HY898_33775 [Deltaproteobacteria bacterium]|nr:hypothetical protein [Deltaproteobacteria bacterium]